MRKQTIDDAVVSMLHRAQAPPSWHPASPEVKEAADKARAICAEKGTDLATISLKRFMKCAA